MNRYEKEWRSYRRQRIAIAAVFIAFVPGMFIFGKFLGRFFRGELAGEILALSWMAAWAVLIARQNFFRCPRCKHYFCGQWWYGQGLWTTSCRHCSLRQYSD